MNQSLWAIRARAKLERAIQELDSPDADEEIIGICLVAVRSNRSAETFCTSSGSLSPLCEPNCMAAALLMESEEIQKGGVAIPIVTETLQ